MGLKLFGRADFWCERGAGYSLVELVEDSREGLMVFPVVPRAGYNEVSMGSEMENAGSESGPQGEGVRNVGISISDLDTLLLSKSMKGEDGDPLDKAGVFEMLLYLISY